MQLTAVNDATHINAKHFVRMGETDDSGWTSLATYSAKTSEIMAMDAGLVTVIPVHEKRNAGSDPYALIK